jgi:hypothetical protein
LFFVAIFTPFHGTITLVALGITLDYVLRVLGVMVFKTIEVLGRKREKMRRKAAELCAGTDSPEGEKNGNDDGSGSEGTSRVFERSRTMDSSITAVSEEAPLKGIRQCNKAVTKNYRIPGQFDFRSTLSRHLMSTFVCTQLSISNIMSRD